MPKYHIEWIDHEYRSAVVTAESESAARQCWIDEAFDYEEPSYTETGEGPAVRRILPEGVHPIDWESVALVTTDSDVPLVIAMKGGFTVQAEDIGGPIAEVEPTFEGAPMLMLDENTMRKVRELINDILED